MKLYRDVETQEAIDQEYNIEVAVGDMRPYVERFVQGSAAARRELECAQDVRFGPTCARSAIHGCSRRSC